MSRHGRITRIRRAVVDEPNRYAGVVSAEIRVFAPPFAGLAEVETALRHAYDQALLDVRRDYSACPDALG